MTEVRLCKDCKWCAVDRHFEQRGDHEAAVEFAKCRRPGVFRLDKVTGVPGGYCSVERDINTTWFDALVGIKPTCSDKGRYWEPL